LKTQGALARAIEAYSDDEERDSSGKWTSGDDRPVSKTNDVTVFKKTEGNDSKPIKLLQVKDGGNIDTSKLSKSIFKDSDGITRFVLDPENETMVFGNTDSYNIDHGNMLPDVAGDRGSYDTDFPRGMIDFVNKEILFYDMSDEAASIAEQWDMHPKQAETRIKNSQDYAEHFKVTVDGKPLKIQWEPIAKVLGGRAEASVYAEVAALLGYSDDEERDDHGKWTSGGSLKPAEEDRTQWPQHIQDLKVPPAWKDVHYSEDPTAALLAVGKDAKGRDQRVYSKDFQDSQAALKFERVEELGKQLPLIDQQLSADRKSDDDKTREHADAALLVRTMGVRPGSETDTKAKVQAYGATTLEGRHVRVSSTGNVRLNFTGKKGVGINLPVEDKQVAAMLASRKADAGNSGQIFPRVSNSSLLDYVHSNLDHGGFKSKDFRTYLGTSTAQGLVSSMKEPATPKDYVKAVRSVASAVAEKLGNTPAVALSSYIAPQVFSGWKMHAGVTAEAMELPQVYYGEVSDNQRDFRDVAGLFDSSDTDDGDDSDGSVEKMLGFDPAKMGIAASVLRRSTVQERAQKKLLFVQRECATLLAEFDEEQHPRDEHGKFTDGGLDLSKATPMKDEAAFDAYFRGGPNEAILKSIASGEPMEASDQRVVKALDDAIASSRLTKSLVAYRGLRDLEGLEKALGFASSGGWHDDLGVGKSLVDAINKSVGEEIRPNPSFSSFSTSPDSAMTFMPIVAKVKFAAGDHVYRPLSDTFEHEVLAGRGMVMRIAGGATIKTAKEGEDAGSKYVLFNVEIVKRDVKAAFDEAEHPRDDHGKFTDGGETTTDQTSWHFDDFHPEDKINGIPLSHMSKPDFEKYTNPDLKETPLKVGPGQHAAAGIIMIEPGNKVWIVTPDKYFGGYRNTFPKGTQESGEALQTTAVRETYEESGLVGKITGVLGDVDRTTSSTRYYIGERVGGSPAMAGEETYAVKLLDLNDPKTDERLQDVMGKTTKDADVLSMIREHLGIEQPAQPEAPATGKMTAADIMDKKIGGAQGSNVGGFYKGTDGVDRYVKLYNNPEQAHGEVLANTIYRDLNINAPQSQVFGLPNGKEAFASDIVHGGKTLEQTGVTKENAREVLKGFAADVLTANWDVVGLTYDNILMKGGEAHRLDNGSAFLYRAQGSAKPAALLNQTTELKSFFTVNKEFASMAKKAGVTSADQVPGFRSQVKAIAELQKVAGGWDKYLDAKAPYLSAGERSKIGSMLTSRTEGLKVAAGVGDSSALHDKIKSLFSEAEETVLREVVACSR